MSQSSTDMNVASRVRTILCDLLLLEPEEVTLESQLVGDLDVDSIALLELSFHIEESFGVDFPHLRADEETFRLTLPDALRRLEERRDGSTFFQFVKEEVVRAALAAGSSGGQDREEVFRAQTVGSIVNHLGGQVPADLDAAAPLSTLRLLDLLRLVTVRALVGYVEHLVAAKNRASAGVG